jgi:hypothetical protein
MARLEVDGFIAVNAQSTSSPTFTEIDGSLLVQDGVDYQGLRTTGSVDVVTTKIDAVTSTAQNIRMNVTVGGVDVTDAITGGIQVTHNLNYISSFSFTLGDYQYSPKQNSNIDIDAIVVITAYINGQTFKMFTGLVDELRSTNSPKGYRLQVTGRDYGKKLLNTTKTYISIQDRANLQTRGSIIAYLISKTLGSSFRYNVSPGDTVTIDHSFQDQTVWDMIQKECAIQGWYVRFNEENTMQVLPRDSYWDLGIPIWTYGEDKFTEVGLTCNDEGIINKVIILGAIFEETEVTVETTEGTPDQVIVEPETYDYATHSYSESYATGIVPSSNISGETATVAEDSNFKVTVKYIGWDTQEGLPFNPYQNYQFTITRLNSDLTVSDVEWTVSGSATTYSKNNSYCRIHRKTFGFPTSQQGAFSISITIKTKEQTGGGVEEIEGTAPEETFTETTTYEQVKATVIDNDSIVEYGERKPNNEGTLNFPLAETTAQCQRIGENIIKDSHRFIEQPDFIVPFNPKLIVGHTVSMTDTKIGYNSDRYLVEEVVHSIDIPKDGHIKARTRIGCVYYS